METSDHLIRRRKLTAAEVDLAERAAQLIKEYRLASKMKGGIYPGITADQLVSSKVKDSSRQIVILDLACLLESEARRSERRWMTALPR